MKRYHPYNVYDVYDPNAPGGWTPRENPKREVAENFDPYHDELGRFSTKDGAATPRGADGPHSKSWQDKNKPVFIAQTQVEPTPTPAPPVLSRVDAGPLTFDKLRTHYPSPNDYPTIPTDGLTTIWDLILGKVKENEKGFGNSCTVRVSYALNRSGLPIPFLKGLVSTGADGMWYFYRVRALDAYLRQRLGPPITVIPLPNWRLSLQHQHGIIEFDVPTGWSDANGHMTLFDGREPVDGHDYTEISRTIYFWPLP